MIRTPAVVILLSAFTALSASAQTTFQYDDGTSNITLGPPRSFEQFGDIDMLWGNYFTTDGPGVVLDTISFGLGELSEGGNISLWIFDDADNDFDPTNATPIFSTSLTAMNTGFDLIDVAIDPTLVEGGFFVAIGHLAELTGSGSSADYPSPARFDPDALADRSWFFYDSDIPENDLASSGFFSRMDGPQVPIQGAFAIRATGTPVPAPGSAVVLAAVGLGVSRRRRA